MSCLSAPGGQLGPGRVALYSRLWNDALRWFRPQKPHSADQQRRVPGAHATLRCVRAGVVGSPALAHALCCCVNACKESPAFPVSSLQVFAFWQCWLVRLLDSDLPRWDFQNRRSVQQAGQGACLLVVWTWASLQPYWDSIFQLKVKIWGKVVHEVSFSLCRHINPPSLDCKCQTVSALFYCSAPPRVWHVGTVLLSIAA